MDYKVGHGKRVRQPSCSVIASSLGHRQQIPEGKECGATRLGQFTLALASRAARFFRFQDSVR